MLSILQGLLDDFIPEANNTEEMLDDAERSGYHDGVSYCINKIKSKKRELEKILRENEIDPFAD